MRSMNSPTSSSLTHAETQRAHRRGSGRPAFNSSEKRRSTRAPARGPEMQRKEQAEKIVGKVSQETWAEMIGTTRSRVSYFMNKFRRLGYIKYNGGLQINSSLLRVILKD